MKNKIENLKNTKFFSIEVEPINDIEEGKKTGHYDSIYDHISSKTVPLQKAIGKKRIYFIPVNERVEQGKEAEFLAKYGKRPVTNAPNYLLGAMTKLQKKDLPDRLKRKDIIAVSSDKKEVFIDRRGRPCFLSSFHRSDSRRLRLVSLKDVSRPCYVWDFLAEDIQ